MLSKPLLVLSNASPSAPVRVKSGDEQKETAAGTSTEPGGTWPQKLASAKLSDSTPHPPIPEASTICNGISVSTVMDSGFVFGFSSLYGPAFTGFHSTTERSRSFNTPHISVNSSHSRWNF
jgi:hypothetical protein